MEERFGKYTYDGTFDGNILIVGRTGCGKTTFIQKLAQNKRFGENIINVFWVSKIYLSPEREESIRDCFIDQNVQFAYPSNIDDFNFLIDNFMSERSPSISENNMGELPQINKLIIIDDVSGLADKSEDFSNFLTVSRKYGFSCVYVFHTIYPGRQSWEMIMSQTHIFNFFPGSIHSGRILKTLSLFASRQKHTYLPNSQVWLNKLYFQISNSNEKKCLTIDTRDVNDLGPGKFRTSAENNLEQNFYFNRNNADARFKSYVAKRVSPDKLVFSISDTNFDQNFGYKNLEINSKNLLSNGLNNRASESVNKENIRNEGSENSERNRGSNESLQCEPTSSRKLSFRRARLKSRSPEQIRKNNKIFIQVKNQFQKDKK